MKVFACSHAKMVKRDNQIKNKFSRVINSLKIKTLFLKNTSSLQTVAIGDQSEKRVCVPHQLEL